jgi:mRNA interferase HigB
VAVFDVGGNKYRLIAALHYDYARAFVLRVMTHREYDKARWKEEL